MEIGDYAWIGAGATVLPGVRVGRHAVIGAASVVTKDVPDYAVAVGNPARVIKMLDKEKIEDCDNRSRPPFGRLHYVLDADLLPRQ